MKVRWYKLYFLTVFPILFGMSFCGIGKIFAQDSFPDISKHWARKNIEKLVKQGGITGYDTDGDGKGDIFRPNAPVTRAELAVLIIKSLQPGKPLKLSPTSTPFSDVTHKHWASGYINLAVKKGIITGFSDGTFKPNKKTTRAEITAIILRAMGREKYIKVIKNKHTDIITLPFTDIDNKHWSASYVVIALRENVVGGYKDQTFRPNQNVTRAEAATMIIRMQEEKVNKQSAILTQIKGKVQIQSKFFSHNQWMDAWRYILLYPEDKLKTSSSSKAEIKFDDGSIVRLGDNTYLEIQKMVKDNEGSRENILKQTAGKIWVMIKKLTKGKRKFEVITPTAVAGVRSTGFMVEIEMSLATKVLVFKGSVGVKRFTPKPEEQDLMKEFLIKAGEKTTISAGKDPELPKPMTEEEMKMWEEEFSGLVIDARGLGGKISMSPKIIDEQGRDIYGKIQVDVDFVIEEGIISYASSLEEAKNLRAGINPLVVKAIKVETPMKNVYVIKNEDADKILEANKSFGFLEQFAVVIVLDKE